MAFLSQERTEATQSPLLVFQHQISQWKINFQHAWAAWGILLLVCYSQENEAKQTVPQLQFIILVTNWQSGVVRAHRIIKRQLKSSVFKIKDFRKESEVKCKGYQGVKFLLQVLISSLRRRVAVLQSAGGKQNKCMSLSGYKAISRCYIIHPGAMWDWDGHMVIDIKRRRKHYRTSLLCWKTLLHRQLSEAH